VNFGFKQPQLFEPQVHSIFQGIPILEQAQGWFESLWDWVSKSAYGAAEWLLSRLGDVLGRWNPETSRIEGGLFGWIWDALSGVSATFGSWISSLWTAISGSVNWLSETVWSWFEGALSWMSDSFRWISGRISEGASWIVDNIREAISSSVTGVTQAVTDAFSGISDALTNAFASIAKAASDAIAGVGPALVSAFQGAWNWLVKAAPETFGNIATWLSESIVTPIERGMAWIHQRISDTVTNIIQWTHDQMSNFGRMTPDKALNAALMATAGAVISGSVINALLDIAGIKVVGSGFTFDGMNRFLNAVLNPQLYYNTIIGTIVGVGLQVSLRQYYNAIFLPEIPDVQTATKMLWRGLLTEAQFTQIVAWHGFGDPYDAAFLGISKEIPQRQDLNVFLWRGLIDVDKYQSDLQAQGVRAEDLSRYVELTHLIPSSADLIRMVVREAFDPTVVVKAPEIFSTYMQKVGFAAEWSDRFWTAHFEPIALGQAYQNYWRGNWTAEQLKRMLTIADVHPMWHDDILAVAFRPPSARELGYGYDTGEYTVDDITRYRRWAGLSPEDATRAARSLVAYRTEAERNSLRTEAMNDFVAGLDDEATLRSKLAAVGTRPEVVDLWVARAYYRAQRDLVLDLVKAATTEYIKGLLSEGEFVSFLQSQGIVPERVSVILADATARKRKAAKAEAVERKRLVTEAKLTTALELGLVSPDAYKLRLVEINYTPEDAQLLYAIATTPLPLTSEERERRVKVIESRIARLNRRYDLIIQRLDQQVTLISDEIEAAAATQSEVLDVYDTSLLSLSAELAAAPPEKVAGITARINLVKERRDVAIARYTEQSTRLQDNLAAAADRKQEILKQRSEEITELEGELSFVQGK